MEMLVLGAGLQGSACAFDLLQHPDITRVRLADLEIGPLDCLSLADAAEVPQQSELEARILLAAALPAGAESVRIDFDPALLPAGAISFPDFFFLAKSLRGREWQWLTIPPGGSDAYNLRPHREKGPST